MAAIAALAATPLPVSSWIQAFLKKILDMIWLMTLNSIFPGIVHNSGTHSDLVIKQPRNHLLVQAVCAPVWFGQSLPYT